MGGRGALPSRARAKICAGQSFGHLPGARGAPEWVARRPISQTPVRLPSWCVAVLVTRTQLDDPKYHELRFAWGRRVWRHNLFKPTAGPNVAWPHPDSRRVWPGNAAVLWPVWIFFPASWRHCAKRLTIFWRVLKKPVIYKPSPVWAGFQWLD